MKREQVAGTLDRVKKFFAETPGQNADGTTGINTVIVWGNEFPDSDKSTPYPDLYEKGMPKEWRGIGHGVLLEPGTGGGGQANRNDWAGISNNWMTVVHELGHQFGLGHEPAGSPGQSPLYTSLMNYDYSYGFNGNGEAIHLSSGKFAKVKLDETRLDERLPFPETDLAFLTHGPYSFRLQKVDDQNTLVDWNRNGVFGENPVRADIDDGYGIGIREQHRLGKAAGSAALAAANDQLFVAYPDLADAKTYTDFKSEAPSKEMPANLVLRVFRDGKWTEKAILAEGAIGEPSIVVARNNLFLAYQSARGLTISSHSLEEPYKRLATARIDADGEAPALVAGKSQIWLITRKSDGTVWSRRIRTGNRFLQIGEDTIFKDIICQTPVSAAYDSKLDRIVFVTTSPHNNLQGRMQIHIAKAIDKSLAIESSRWTMGENGHSRTLARPTILFDPSRDRGPNGGYLIYHKGEVPTNTHSATWLSRTIADKTASDGWRTSLIGNEWLLTRSAPSAVLYGDDVAYAIRWFGGDLDHELLVNLKASGVIDGLIADHDDVGFIRTKGLRQSLGR